MIWNPNLILLQIHEKKKKEQSGSTLVCDIVPAILHPP